VTGDEPRRLEDRAKDPLYDQRAEMSGYEFDGVDFFCNEAGRGTPPPPTVLAYFDSGVDQQHLADQLDHIVASMAATLTRTTTFTLSPEAQWVTSSGGVCSGEWSSDTGDTLATDLRTRGVDLLHLIFTERPDARHRWTLTSWHPNEPGAALSMSLSSMDLWPAEATDRAADEVLALLRRWARPLRLRTAGVTYDRGGPSESPWEKWYAISHSKSAILTTERLRGYFWANLLTTGHTARLGGVETLRRNAAARGLLVEPANAEGDEDEAVVVRAPGPITGFDDDLLAATKHVLGPALIHQQYALYEGYPLRIIPDPGTAFRKVPPGSPFPRLLDGRGPYADEVP
jgi:hypothetical protein